MKNSYKSQVRLLIGIFLSVLFLCSQHLSAQTRLSESFNYAQGTTLSNTGWVTITGTPLITVVDGNLTYPNTIAANMGNKIALGPGGQNVYKSFISIPVNADGLAAYASMVVNVSAAQTGNYFFALGSTASAHNARIYIQANGSGYSFGIGKTAAAADYETTVRPFGENVLLVLKYEAFTGTSNDIIRLYVNPPLSVESPATAVISIAPAIADVASLNHAFLVQAAAASGPTLEVDGINIGDTWSSVTSAIFDYGDVPDSYEFSKDGVYMPAAHMRISGLSLGSILPNRELAPHSVAPGEDNNGTNGDGAEEDAIDPATVQIRKGAAFVLDVPVTNTSGTKYLYGWIDFNNDGKFEAGEFVTASFSTAGTSTQTLTWTGLQTAEIPDGVEKLYMRLRLSDRILNDFTTAAGGGADMDERSIGFGAISTTNVNDHGTIPNGEVEDYQIEVVNTFDYGDLPVSFENDKDDNYLPAVHAPLEGFSIGDLLDVETTPASVTAPAENNIAGDNAVGEADEDGITEFVSVSRGVAYSISVPVNIPATLTGTKYLYGWLDLNGDGRFQLGEVATATTTLTGNSYITLTWTAAQTTSIALGTTHIYTRLRLSNLQLLDFTTAASGGAIIDERSVGNGATATGNPANNPIVAFGEVEDYQLPVDFYDFGDLPVSYELNNASDSYPARQIANSSYTIGQLVEHESAPFSVLPGEDNNGTNGDGLEEDGLITLPLITRGAPFNFSVPVTVAAGSSVIAWVDFNNDGKFQANEVAYTAVSGTGTGYQTVSTGTTAVTFWFRGAQTALIPPGTEHLYVRIRLTQTAGADNAATTDIDERSIADGANTGIYTLPRFGEVEDYRFEVADELYDFGDAPESYEMDKDGTAPANFKPARNYPTNALHLGNSFDLESGPASVAPGADNNGTNGDGITDDGLASNQLFIKSGALNSFVVSVTNNTGAAATLYGWIDLNNNGRFEAGEVQTVSVANGATSATLNFTAAQINSIDAATQKLYMRLRLIQPETGVTIADFTTAAQGGAVVDERSIADGLITGEYGSVSRGEVEDYQLTVIRDYGDVPSSYENGNPAYHTNTIVPELMIGETVDYELAPNSVAPGVDNNGLNGDGEDEDGISVPQTITSGAPFSIVVPINTTVTGTKQLYGWIDFNGDGFFNGNEAALASGSVTAGTTGYFTLTWNNTEVSPAVLAEGKTYVRLRLSGAALTNTNSGNTTLIDTRSYGGSNAVGEIEDYQFLVSDLYDYGDAPITYDMNKFGTDPEHYLPARQAPSPLLRLGELVEAESAPNSVADGADNNGTNGDGAEEDAIALMPVHRGTIYYSRVSVMNNTGSNKTLYGWIDFNNDGRFQASEVATVTVPSNAEQQTVTLSWTAVNTNTIPVGVENVYMRLRISAGTLSDWTTAASFGAVVDERAIGDGLAGTAAATPYGVAQIGEIEDYRLPVVTIYDYGDLPDSYDTNRNDIVAPARQAISSGLYIGDNPADAEAAKLTSADALGDDQDGIDDEDGLDLDISPIYAGGGAGYTARVKVTNFTGAARTLYGWIDFNNDGRFQATEVATVSVPNNTDGGLVTLTWSNPQSVFDSALTELNIRLRISQGTLTDFITGAPGALVDERALADGLNTGEYAASPVIFNGEVEDHKIPVSTDLDYGDVPESYEYNNSGVILPARHLPNEALLIGNTVDTEPGPQSVAPGADNNGANGDGLDEDGVVFPLPTLISGSEYSVLVNVTNNLTTAATLHAWIDMDGNGRFTSDEYTSVLLSANSGSQTAQLYWYTTSYTGTAANTYMRIRLTSAALADNPSTADVDERSIGDGLSTGVNATYPINGEVEDYSIPVDLGATQGEPQPCDAEDDRLGLMDPIQALFHATIAKTANGDWLVFGANTHGSGTHQMTPAKLESGFNGYNFQGNPLMATGASIYGLDFTHQYCLLTTTGLYVWGTSGIVIPGVSNAMSQLPLPLGVSPADVQMIDAGRGVSIGSLMLLTKTGEIWVYSNVIGSDVQGDGSIVAAGWHQVMLNVTTPLTGMKDVRTSGAAAIATDGNSFYTWGSDVFLGDGLQASNKSYATQMVTPTGITLPIKQQSINHRNNTAYYLRDGEGKVFVLGANEDGQLGLGNTSNTQNWLTITQMNEEPDAPGNQPDVTKPIKKVIWISANNHDSWAPIFGLITEEHRAYTTGNNDGVKSGTVGPTTRYLPTAVTIGNGAQMMEGKMIYLEVGGHISILIKDRNDRYGYVGHTVEGSDGCGGCTNSPAEFNFSGPPSTGPVCGNTAFDYGDLDDRYNLGDGASHEIKFSQNDNPLKLGSIAADSEDWAQFTITGSGNDAMGDDDDEQGDDEDALTAGSLPIKVPGVPYTLEIPLTNNTGETAYLYGFIDWNDNGRFDPYEAVVEEVPSSETPQTITLTWADDILIDCQEGEVVRGFVRLRLTTALLEDDADTPEDERSFLAAPDGEVEDYYLDWEPDCSVCTMPGAGGTPDGYTVVGVTTHTELTSNWPATVPNGWLAIESATKGFVITRVQNDAVITDPKSGMLIYDIDADCVKLFRDGEWNCIEQTCISVD
ncbi:GEVED domain-containing protein [Belliella marina]|uniref:GEVED domain-containing protein n=1 Tax=Belliella marina TaxID=1644146 RepID=A0ABW4VPE0_9BACT